MLLPINHERRDDENIKKLKFFLGKGYKRLKTDNWSLTEERERERKREDERG